MLIHELTHHQCAEVLARLEIGRLACSRLDQPYVVPIRFSYDGDRNCLYGFSSLGRKIEWMRENPKVCVEVEDIESNDRWTTLVIFGRYEEIDDSPELSGTRQRIWELFQQRPQWWFPAAAKIGSRERHAMVIYRIQIDRMTGRRSLRDSNA
jgi:nitroimidazol reductase NimA-like FMN-containing flavoprotein (pyridoxamine 5'-phosphate oxidase superfamily)